MDDRRRVAVIITRCVTGSGGVAVRGLLGLDPSRYRRLLVTGERSGYTEAAAADGVEVVLVPSLVSPLRPLDDARALARLIGLLRDFEPHVVHTHSAKAGVLGRLAARAVGAECVVHTMHGFPWHEFQRPAVRAAYVRIERLLSRSTDHYLAVGTGVAVEMVRRGLADPAQLHTVGPVVEPSSVTATAASRSAARRLLGLADSDLVVGTVGRLDYQKDPETMLRALARMRLRAVLVWVGDGPLADVARRQAHELGLGERVLFLGHRGDVAQLLPAFDVFALSSRYEGLPCVIVEAQQCGIPVVATAVNGVPDLVVPGESGLLVAPEQPVDLARALDHSLSHPDQREQWVSRARAQLGDRYDPLTTARLLGDLYAARTPTAADRPALVGGRP